MGDVPRTTTTLQMKSGVVRHNNTFVSARATTFVGVVVLGMVGFVAYQNNTTTTTPTGSRMSMTTIPEISGADSTSSFFRMADVVGAEEDEEEEEEVGTEEEEDEDEEDDEEEEDEGTKSYITAVPRGGSDLYFAGPVAVGEKYNEEEDEDDEEEED